MTEPARVDAADEAARETLFRRIADGDEAAFLELLESGGGTVKSIHVSRADVAASD